MSTKTLEKKLTELQRRVAEIETKIGTGAKPGWEKIAGAASQDQHLEEAMKLGKQWRKKANQEDW